MIRMMEENRRWESFDSVVLVSIVFVWTTMKKTVA